MIKVIDNTGRIVARVKPNTNLDRWDGHNWTNGSVGNHSGLTQLSDGRFVHIHTTQWIGASDYAEIIDASEALQLVLESDSPELLNQFLELKVLAEQSLLTEAM